VADTPVRLQQPNALKLARIDERLTFLYLDRCAVRQDDNGTVAAVETENGLREVYLPTATLTALMLGPGTSLTQQAAAALARSGCAVVFTGAGLVRSYGAFLSPYAPTRLLERQAAIVSDPGLRAEAARVMYLKRFPGVPSSTFADATIEQMRGLEGVRMKATYQRCSAKARLGRWRRNSGTDPGMGPPDSVNRALNSANSALYGVVNSVVLALGLSPGLGVIHTGNRQSFTLDIADLYKADLTIPLAFALNGHEDPENAALRKLREGMRLARFLPRVVEDIHDVLGEQSVDPRQWSVDELRLWGSFGEVPANRSQSGFLS